MLLLDQEWYGIYNNLITMAQIDLYFKAVGFLKFFLYTRVDEILGQRPS